jgi:Tol biopolymer transport system component
LNGKLAFQAEMAQDTYTQIYIWDGQTATNISQNPTMPNNDPSWSRDGRWAFSTFYTSPPLIYVRDADNRSLLTAEGQWPTWSPGDNLMFCTQKQSKWILSTWDGQQVIKVAQAGEIVAEWNGGSGVGCSSG